MLTYTIGAISVPSRLGLGSRVYDATYSTGLSIQGNFHVATPTATSPLDSRSRYSREDDASSQIPNRKPELGQIHHKNILGKRPRPSTAFHWLSASRYSPGAVQSELSKIEIGRARPAARISPKPEADRLAVWSALRDSASYLLFPTLPANVDVEPITQEQSLLPTRSM